MVVRLLGSVQSNVKVMGPQPESKIFSTTAVADVGPTEAVDEIEVVYGPQALLPRVSLVLA